MVGQGDRRPFEPVDGLPSATPGDDPCSMTNHSTYSLPTCVTSATGYPAKYSISNTSQRMRMTIIEIRPYSDRLIKIARSSAASFPLLSGKRS
jgi:hypothetical protein